MADFRDWMNLLSTSQGWFPACLSSAILCALRARGQGYRGPLYGCLGLLLGPGALPVVYLNTLEELHPLATGTGLIRASAAPESTPELLAWQRLERNWRKLQLFLWLGVVLGGLLHLTQCLTHLLPGLFMDSAQDYERGLHPGLEMEVRARLLWVNFALIAPSLGYAALQKWLRWPLLEQLGAIHAYRAFGDSWRESVPRRLRHLPDPVTDDPLPLQREVDQRISGFRPALLPLLLLCFWSLTIGLAWVSLRAYNYLGNLN